MSTVTNILIGSMFFVMFILIMIMAIGLMVHILDDALFGGKLSPRIRQWCQRKTGLDN